MSCSDLIINAPPTIIKINIIIVVSYICHVLILKIVTFTVHVLYDHLH